MKDLDLAAKSYQDALNDLVALATPEQRLAGLAPEQIAAALAPEQRLAGLAPEQVLLTLPDDVLRALSPDYVRTLSDATRAAIRSRIGR